MRNLYLRHLENKSKYVTKNQSNNNKYFKGRAICNVFFYLHKALPTQNKL